MARRATLIVNPKAGRGRPLSVVSEAEAVLESAGFRTQTVLTEWPGHAGVLAAAGARQADALVVLGGDGTLNEAVSGVLQAGPWPDQLTVAPLPLGTGTVFIRDFGLRNGQWREALDRLIAGATRRVDAAHVTYGRGGNAGTAYFVNIFGTGFTAAVADATNRRFKRLGGLGYSAAVFWVLTQLRAPATRLVVEGPEGTERLEAPLTLVAVCNTQWTGDTMWIAPQADASDGLLDVLAFGDVSRLDLLRVFPKIFSGTHLSHPALRCFKATRVTLEPAVDGPLLMDGEVRGTTPVRIEVLPRAFTVSL